MKVHNIAKQVAFELDVDLNEINEKIVWPLDKIYTWAYDAFMIATETPDEVFAKLSISPEWRDVVLNQIKKRMGAKELKLVA